MEEFEKEPANKGVVDFLMLDDEEKQLIVSNLASVVVLGIGVLFSVFFTKYATYIPYMIFILVISNLFIQYILNKISSDTVKLNIDNNAKINELISIVKISRVVISFVIIVKIITIVLL